MLNSVLKNIQLIVLVSLVTAVVWLYKDKEFYKSESNRQGDNVAWSRKYDSLRFSNQVLTSKEIEEHLNYTNPDLKKKLDAANIKISRIESMVLQTLKYRDTVKRESDVSGLVNAIKNSIPKEQSWTDTTKCMTVTGVASFDGQKLKVIVNDRQFKNKTDAVAYWERREWNFLGIKTRFLGRKFFTAKTFDECGETRTMKIEKKE